MEMRWKASPAPPLRPKITKAASKAKRRLLNKHIAVDVKFSEGKRGVNLSVKKYNDEYMLVSENKNGGAARSKRKAATS